MTALSDPPKIPTIDWADFAEGDTEKRFKCAQGQVDVFKKFGFVKLTKSWSLR
ncbi:hypothetical protein PMAA_097810 [Talaromyces marneffei ATCC 18224]|uniref:Uncharacterized protein n=1 Tax=Talaromyces marneffei (strain ATCC 18224 / CBS 334.59 / QM 7333) TaxID=441960 RepID=B6QIJ7_TALMQ|nr:hypothetical protein PMAA_097810 [Talaromyces marneffei ATCC 18224]